MKYFKVLPTALAVAASFASVSTFATESNVEALEKRLAELEVKLADIEYRDDQQPAVLTPETKVPEGVVFSGYARYGAAYKNSDAKVVGSYGALNGNATGRLGNEQNGGEWQLARVYESDSGAKWDIVFMMEHWADSAWATDGGLNVKKMYAGVTNVFDAQPELYMWAGRDFHQRPQTDLNDYFWMMHDGQGAGFYNLNLGGPKLDMGIVGQVEGDMVGDNGRYAVTSKLHNIKLGSELSLSLLANYGWASKQIDGNDTNSYQVAGVASMYGQNLVLRYSHNAINSVFDLADGLDAFMVHFDGSYAFTDQFGVSYQAAYQTLDAAPGYFTVIGGGEGDKLIRTTEEDRSNYNIIVRPTYQWDEVHSTWLEAGYNAVDYDKFDATNESWKVTLSQNMAIGPKTWSRPMLRFYATVGNADNEFTGFKHDGGDSFIKTSNDLDTATFGAMFEAWW